MHQDGLEEIAWRKDKLGFVAPQERWRSELRDQMAEKFHVSKVPDLLDRQALTRLLDNSGITSNSNLSEYWRLMALLRWLDVFDVELV
jgi:hypothetical protein